MKRLLTWLLAASMLLSPLNLTALAAEPGTLVLAATEVTAYPGGQVEVALVIQQNPGFCGLNLYWPTPEALTASPLTNQVAALTCTVDVTAVWDSTTPYRGTGTLATLTFTLPADAAVGQVYALPFQCIEAFDSNLKELPVEVRAGSITVACPHTHTKEVAEEPPTCVDTGLTAGVWCEDCETFLSGREEIPATGDHEDADGLWDTDARYHFRVCACGRILRRDPHAGGRATCIAAATCGICKTVYGNPNPSRHEGDTEVRDSRAPDHKTQTPGYTGDTWCLDCNTLIKEGEAIPADPHTPAYDWATDGVDHWQVCSVAGCGVEIEGTRAPHRSDHPSNGANCQDSAICDDCGRHYGALGGHTFTLANPVPAALKTPGNCRDRAVYYFSCFRCGLPDTHEDNTFLGYWDENTHVGDTTLVGANDSHHQSQTPGYTGNTKCLGCGHILAYGEDIPVDPHVPADFWTVDSDHHWKTCGVVDCGVEIAGSREPHHTEKAENKATCLSLALCDDCGTPYGTLGGHNFTAQVMSPATQVNVPTCREEARYYYSCALCGKVEENPVHTFKGEKNPDNHEGGTTPVNVSQPNHRTQTPGYTGDSQCRGCGEILSWGWEILPEPHRAENRWYTNGTQHWLICEIGNCGVEMLRETHISEEPDHKASCCWQAVCDVCDRRYGDFGDHSFDIYWYWDEEAHWHPCTVPTCTERAELTPHTPDHEGGPSEEHPVLCMLSFMMF
ncbi:MAG: hypothetical protein J6R77_02070, partial [Clostridia bacterium]|nr:hypothetical protein [Clostridia bacterium]